jgi:hypothetical protein
MLCAQSLKSVMCVLSLEYVMLCALSLKSVSCCVYCPWRVCHALCTVLEERVMLCTHCPSQHDTLFKDSAQSMTHSPRTVHTTRHTLQGQCTEHDTLSKDSTHNMTHSSRTVHVCAVLGECVMLCALSLKSVSCCVYCPWRVCHALCTVLEECVMLCVLSLESVSCSVHCP